MRLAGALATYYRYRCPIDAACLGPAGIDADTFSEIANETVDGPVVVDQLAAIGTSAEQILNFDPVQLNAGIARRCTVRPCATSADG